MPRKQESTPQIQDSERVEGPKTIEIEVPDILGLVERYTYVNHMRVSATAMELRIAVADLNATSKKVSEPIGIVMSHEHAKEFVSAMQRVVDSSDKQNTKKSTGSK